MKIKRLIQKHREGLLFVTFGFCTTIVDYLAYFIFGEIVGSDNMLQAKYYLAGNLFSWFFAVAFAYVTNKIFVFKSKVWSARVLWKEIPVFYGTRLVALGVLELGIWLLVSVVGLKNVSIPVFGVAINGDLIAKLIMSLVSTFLNYLFGKLIIFRKTKNTRPPSGGAKGAENA